MSSQVLDVAIIGAGLSGIGAAVHLQRLCPGKSYAVFEARKDLGGTWDLFRYPGIRSDSDMYTMSYKFKPWTHVQSIADGSLIRNYIRDTASEYGVAKHIRYQHKFISADWSSRTATWTLTLEKVDSGERIQLQAKFIISGSGYYRYDKGMTPDFTDLDKFAGQIIHPQLWPESLDYAGKKVIVIGSGATAVTLVPTMAETAAHVTMLQRSPTYMASTPQKDPMRNALRKFLPEKTVSRIVRTRGILLGMFFYKLCRKYPEKIRKFILGHVQKQLGPNYDMTHFTPSYKPWDQRMCAVRDGDMFKAINNGKVSVVTDHIDRFTEKGILLKSGKELEADIVVTATGLEVQMLGGAQLSLDGQPVNLSEKKYYKGAMIEDVPNFSMIFGYPNSSWTLKSDLVSEYICKVLTHMDKQGYAQVTARDHTNVKAKAEGEPFLSLSSGYVRRAIDKLPKQGTTPPWRTNANYLLDRRSLKTSKLQDNSLVFSNPVSHGYGYGTESASQADSSSHWQKAEQEKVSA